MQIFKKNISRNKRNSVQDRGCVVRDSVKQVNTRGRASGCRMWRLSLSVTRMDRIGNEYMREKTHVTFFGDKV